MHRHESGSRDFGVRQRLRAEVLAALEERRLLHERLAPRSARMQRERDALRRNLLRS